MTRTPIIVPGQVYLHTELNEYLVVTAANQGDITYRGQGFNGQKHYESFLEKFGPVDPADLTAEEAASLIAVSGLEKITLTTGWVTTDEDEIEEFYLGDIK